jgi:hypothetical protein
MSRGLLFWVIWVVCLLVWAGATFNVGGLGGLRAYAGGGLIEFVLFGLLGWQVFGPVVHG